jgi:hypothetical protein
MRILPITWRQLVPTIRIDKKVFEALQKQAEPFVDTPNSVLRRLLELESTVRTKVGPVALVLIDRPPKRPATAVRWTSGSNGCS